MMSKILLGFKVSLNFLFSHKKSDVIPPEVKLDDVNNTEMGKPMKVLKCEYRFCLNCLAACFLSGKNEEESQCPTYEVNTLKADISPSFDLQTLLSLLNPLSASVALI